MDRASVETRDDGTGCFLYKSRGDCFAEFSLSEAEWALNDMSGEDEIVSPTAHNDISGEGGALPVSVIARSPSGRRGNLLARMEEITSPSPA